MDLGTNTFHLMVADIQDGKPVIIFRDRQPVKLGKGGINQATIQPDARDRALACMKNFKARIDELNVSRSVAIGTSALRSATNSNEVISAIERETGISVQVISGDEEARYIYLGVREAVDLGDQPALIVDIGGGSVEFIIANHRSILWKISLDIGAQRLMEQYHRHDPITPEDMSSLLTHYRNSLEPLMDAFAKWKTDTLVGSSGTFDTLSEIYCVRQKMPYAPTPETPLTIPAFWEIHKELIAKNRDDRMRIPGMIEMRVDMIVVASCLIAYLLEEYRIKQIRVSSFSLKEGVVAQMVKE